MATIFGLSPQDLYYLSFSFLVFVITVLAVVITVAAFYITKTIMKVGEDVNNSIEEIKRKTKKTFKVFDTFVDLFAGDSDEDEDEEEVYVLKKKKK